MIEFYNIYICGGSALHPLQISKIKTQKWKSQTNVSTCPVNFTPVNFTWMLIDSIEISTSQDMAAQRKDIQKIWKSDEKIIGMSIDVFNEAQFMHSSCMNY